MKNLLKSTLVVAVTVGLAACGNDDFKPATKLDVSGAAIKGSLSFATVNVYDASDIAKATKLSTVPTSIQTDAKGDYSLQVVDLSGAALTGAFVVEVVADADTTMICDATLCGDVARGDAIPASQLSGLTLSTVTYSDGSAVTAEVNSLTTMATDTIIAAASLEGSAINLATVSATDFLALQTDASEIVGAIIGVDLSSSNIFTIDIVDASVSADVSTTDSIAATLTLINASLSSLDVPTGSTLAGEITAYVDAVEAVTSAVLADPEVDLGAAATAAALATINETQAEISEEVADLATEVEMDTGVEVPAQDVPTELDEKALGDTIGDIITPTGATGGTTGAS